MFSIEEKKRKATVTLSLEELDELRNKIRSLEVETSRLKEKKEITITLDGDVYDQRSGIRERDHRMFVYGSYDALVKGFDTWAEIQTFANDLFDKILEKSVERQFYKKFPKWVHNLFGCK